MKKGSYLALALMVSLTISLTACSVAESTSTISNQKEPIVEIATTTLSESTTTTATTTTTAKPSTTTTASQTATSATTTKANDSYEVDSPLPSKNKQKLWLDTLSGTTPLTFNKAMRKNSEVLWHYTGTAKTGVPVTCLVVPETGAIYGIEYALDTEWGSMTYEDDVRTCLKSFLKIHRLPLDTESADITHTMSARRNEGKNEYIIFWRFSFELEKEDVTVSGTIGLSKGKLAVQTIYAATGKGDMLERGYTGDTLPLLIPRWKSE